MSEFNHHASKEKEVSFQKRQEILSSTSIWARHIFDTMRRDEDDDALALVPVTPKELAEEDKQGTLAVYDLTDAWYFEFSILDPDNAPVGMIHYYLKQKTGGIWELSTTGDLYANVTLNIGMLDHRGYVLDEYNSPLGREPLYPELFEPSTADELTFFRDVTERAAFGDVDFDFTELEDFMEGTEKIIQLINRLEKNNPD